MSMVATTQLPSPLTYNPGGQAGEQFSAWVASLQDSPGLVDYTLEPLHILVESQDQRLGGPPQAGRGKYLAWLRCSWRDYNRPCPRATQEPEEPMPMHCVLAQQPPPRTAVPGRGAWPTWRS